MLGKRSTVELSQFLIIYLSTMFGDRPRALCLLGKFSTYPCVYLCSCAGRQPQGLVHGRQALGSSVIDPSFFGALLTTLLQTFMCICSDTGFQLFLVFAQEQHYWITQ